jgi:hypothetical protein
MVRRLSLEDRHARMIRYFGFKHGETAVAADGSSSTQRPLTQAF